MLTIDVPDELAGPLAAEAERRGTTPEALALDQLRALVISKPKSLLDFLGPRVGSVEGTGEAFSQDTGRRFADGLAESQRTRS